IYIGDNKAGRMISNIKYQDKDRLICNYGDGIEIIEKTEKQLITEFDNNATYSDIDVTNAYVIAKEEKTGLFSVDTNINIITINNQKESTYKIGSSIKELYVYGDKLAINLGTEVHFINTNAWLLKKYTSNQEIKEIVMGDSIAGIVYRDKIEILSI
ncbi:MAG: hypothetical protein IJV31_05900, partial [Clostridia bacterium]|nr:hypothetical protein [Clostridia bacterium]